jgi:hypothetical protein
MNQTPFVITPVEGLRLAEPKSERAKRQLRIPQVCLMAMLNQRVTQDKERQWAGSKWQDGGFVFTTGVGTPMHPDDVSRLFPAVLKAAKLPKVPVIQTSPGTAASFRVPPATHGDPCELSIFPSRRRRLSTQRRSR